MEREQPARPAGDHRQAFGEGDAIFDRVGLPVGVVEAVIRPVSGTRLVVAISSARDRYVVIPCAAVASTCERPIGPATRHVLVIDRAAVFAGTTYRREMGRLVPDPAALVAATRPQPVAWADDDARTADTVRDGLANSRLTSGEPIEVEAWHGVVHLHGRVATDVGAVEAIRVARGTTGVWHAVTSLVSDEALATHLRRVVRTSPAAGSVAAIAVVRGAAVVTLVEGATIDGLTLAGWQEATPGIATLVARPHPTP